MNVYIPLGLILTLLCYLCSKNEVSARKAFIFSMFAAFLFAAFRFEFGPDYFNYNAIYDSIQGADIDSYTGKGMSVEKPFLILLSIFPNFTSFVIFLAVLWFIPVAYFLSRYVSPSYYWIAVLYLFVRSDFFLSSMVAMRSTLCAAIFMYALFFLLRRKRWIYVALIILASQFHTSAIVLVLLAFFSTNSKSIIFSNSILLILGGIALLSFATGENKVMELMTSAIMENVEELQRYSEREIGGASQSFFSLIFRIIAFYVLYYLVKSGERESDPEMVIIYKIAVCAASLTLIFGQSLISDRYLMILNPVFIAAIIHSFSKNRNDINALVIILLIITALYIFYNKTTHSYFITFLNYHTIFSAPVIP